MNGNPFDHCAGDEVDAVRLPIGLAASHGSREGKGGEAQLRRKPPVPKLELDVGANLVFASQHSGRTPGSPLQEPDFPAKLQLYLNPGKPRHHLPFAKQELGGQVRSQAELGNKGAKERGEKWLQ